MKVNANTMRPGHVMEMNGKLWVVIKQQIVQPGKGGAFIQLEMRDVRTGIKTAERFRTQESVERVRLDEHEIAVIDFARYEFRAACAAGAAFAGTRHAHALGAREHLGNRAAGPFACQQRRLRLGRALRGLDEVFSKLPTKTIDVVIGFDEVNARLSAAVQPSMFTLYAAPAINLFEKTMDRVPVQSNKYEYHVVPDRAHYLEYEPHRILDVYAHYPGGVDKTSVKPLYSAGGGARGLIGVHAVVGPDGLLQAVLVAA